MPGLVAALGSGESACWSPSCLPLVTVTERIFLPTETPLKQCRGTMSGLSWAAALSHSSPQSTLISVYTGKWKCLVPGSSREGTLLEQACQDFLCCGCWC